MFRVPFASFLFVVVIHSYGQTVNATNSAGGNREIKTGFCTISGGSLYYEECGQGTPLILIHGGALDSRMWDQQFLEFSNTFRVIRYDARNHGKSKSEIVPYSHADDLAGLMDSLRIDQAVILGLSMGGYIAIDFALKYPEKVKALIPVAPGLTGYEFKDPQILEYNAKLKTAQTYEEAVEYILRQWCDGPVRTPAQVDSTVRNRVQKMYLDFFQNFQRGLKENRSDPPAINRLAEIKKPVFIIVGDLDQPGILEIARMIEEKVPGAKKIVIKGVAHMVNLEKPDDFNATVIRFLQGY